MEFKVFFSLCLPLSQSPERKENCYSKGKFDRKRKKRSAIYAAAALGVLCIFIVNIPGHRKSDNIRTEYGRVKKQKNFYECLIVGVSSFLFILPADIFVFSYSSSPSRVDFYSNCIGSLPLMKGIHVLHQQSSPTGLKNRR